MLSWKLPIRWKGFLILPLFFCCFEVEWSAVIGCWDEWLIQIIHQRSVFDNSAGIQVKQGFACFCSREGPDGFSFTYTQRFSGRSHFSPGGEHTRACVSQKKSCISAAEAKKGHADDDELLRSLGLSSPSGMRGTCSVGLFVPFDEWGTRCAAAQTSSFKLKPRKLLRCSEADVRPDHCFPLALQQSHRKV